MYRRLMAGIGNLYQQIKQSCAEAQPGRIRTETELALSLFHGNVPQGYALDLAFLKELKFDPCDARRLAFNRAICRDNNWTAVCAVVKGEIPIGDYDDLESLAYSETRRNRLPLLVTPAQHALYDGLQADSTIPDLKNNESK